MDYARYHEDHSIRVEVDDKVAVVTLDRPKQKNAVDFRVHRGLEHLMLDLGSDPEVGAVVLTGEGDSFCAGGDLVNFFPPDAVQSDTLKNRHLNWALAQCEAPLVAAVNGPALGLGATIALMCDVIFMADTAKIGDTHVKVGLTAGDGGQVIWPLLIGLHRAKEFLMTGKLLSGVEAERIGLVNHCVPADDLMDKAMAFARDLAHGPQVAIRTTKQALNKLVYQNLNLMLDFGLAAEITCEGTEDMKEAIAAFQEKRKPVFKGR